MNDSEDFDKYLKWRSGFIIKLALFHFALILTFDTLCIYAPKVITASLIADSAITVGVAYALGIVVSVICATFYYSHRITQEEMKFTDVSMSTDKQGTNK